MRRRAADEDVDAERHAARDRRGVVHADAAVDLVVQADLAVRLVLVAGELHAVHAQVGVPPAGPVGVLGVDLRQRDERPAVARPALRAAAAGRSSSGVPGPGRGGRISAACASSVRRHVAVAPAAACQNAAGSTFSSTRWRTASSVSRNRKRVRSRVPNRLLTIGKAAALDAREVQGRPAGLVDAAVDLGRFQVRVDLLLDADELAGPFQVVDALPDFCSEGGSAVQGTIPADFLLVPYSFWSRNSTRWSGRKFGAEYELRGPENREAGPHRQLQPPLTAFTVLAGPKFCIALPCPAFYTATAANKSSTVPGSDCPSSAIPVQ